MNFTCTQLIGVLILVACGVLYDVFAVMDRRHRFGWTVLAGFAWLCAGLAIGLAARL